MKKRSLFYVFWMLLLAGSAAYAQIDVSLVVGDDTGANTKFDVTRSLIYNFGVSTAGRAQNLRISAVDMFMNRGQQADGDITIALYSGFGAVEGSTLLASRTVSAHAVSTSSFTMGSYLLDTPLSLDAGEYSLKMTTSSTGSGADTYKFKSGSLKLVDGNGQSLDNFFWVEG